MGDARTEAVEAMAHATCTPGEPGSCDLCKENAALQLDAIPTAALVRLLIDRGGLEQAAGHHDAYCPPFGECACGPVYRLSEDPGFCPACGVGRFANEMGDDPDADVWPGTRTARLCPKCGSDQKPEEKPNDG